MIVFVSTERGGRYLYNQETRYIYQSTSHVQHCLIFLLLGVPDWPRLKQRERLLQGEELQNSDMESQGSPLDYDEYS